MTLRILATSNRHKAVLSLQQNAKSTLYLKAKMISSNYFQIRCSLITSYIHTSANSSIPSALPVTVSSQETTHQSPMGRLKYQGVKAEMPRCQG